MQLNNMNRLPLLMAVAAALISGCTSIKQSDTARTGIEQLLISSAADRALDKFNLKPIAGAKVFVDTQYFDSVDKNYILVALHERLLKNNCTLVSKADDADVVVEIGSGGVGTDRNEMYLGFPGLALPPPATLAIPKLAFFERSKSMGTVKLSLVAIDTRTKQAVINSGYKLARADHRHWQVLGLGSQQSGSVQEELVTKTGEDDSAVGAARLTFRPKNSTSR
jgi:Family of unknown function (DUF6655)